MATQARGINCCLNLKLKGKAKGVAANNVALSKERESEEIEGERERESRERLTTLSSTSIGGMEDGQMWHVACGMFGSCQQIATPAFPLSLSLCIFLFIFLFFPLCCLRTFHLGAAYEIYGFYYVIYAMRAVRDGARNARRSAACGFLRRKCAHRLRVKSRTHTRTDTHAHWRGRGCISVFYYCPPVFIATAALVFYLFNFSAAIGRARHCPCHWTGRSARERRTH